MKHSFWRAGLLAAGLAANATAQPAAPDPGRALQTAEMEWTVIEDYCMDCHNFEDQAGGVAFDILPLDHLADDAGIWEKALRKLRTGLMPPAGEARPPRTELDAFIGQLETRLDRELAADPNPGAEQMSRLNRAEYANAVRDLLAFDAGHALDKLPSDAKEEGFDNIASELNISPTLIEGYLSTAMRISREAVGDRAMIPTQVRYEAGGGPQTRHVEGLPLGTRGGMLVSHNFPLDAEYEIHVGAGGGPGLGGPGFCEGPGLTLTLDGEPLSSEDPRLIRLRLPAGPHTIGAALVDDKRCEGVNELYDVYALSGSVRTLEIHGPYDPTGPGDTPSRRAIFVCHPNSDSEAACAREILSRLATLAYRRPVEQDAPELEPLLQFYRMGRDLGDFEAGIQYALSRLLVDPRFLFRVEEAPTGLPAGEIYRVSDLDLASRLSFFLWSSIPDRELIELGAAGRLSEPAVLEAQVLRMLADPRSQALVDNFAGQWLRLRELDSALPQDPAFNDGLRAAFRAETELLFKDLIHEDRGLLHLLSADYTYLNEQLAGHYGIEGVRGDFMRRVALPADSPRRGLLGHGSILTATSVANRTSPVIRGEWIIENILGAPVPVPPPGVEADLSEETGPGAGVVNTLRERLELHRADPTCAACHQIMDPVGLALENFDLIGRWRDSENGHPIDTSATLVDGTRIDSPADLREALLARGDTVAATMTEQLLTYALGRELEAYDMPAVRAITGSAAPDYRFSAIVLGIVNSLPFQYKQVTEADVEARLAAAAGGRP